MPKVSEDDVLCYCGRPLAVMAVRVRCTGCEKRPTDCTCSEQPDDEEDVDED